MLNDRRKVLPAGHLDIVVALNNLASVLSGQGRYRDLEELVRRGIREAEQARSALSPATVAVGLNNLAFAVYGQGRYREAENLFKQALDNRMQILPPDHPDIAQSLSNLAAVLSAQGRHEEAEALQRRALSIREKRLAKGHPDITISLNNLAVEYQAQGKLQEAEALFRQAVTIREQVLSPNQPLVAESVYNLAQVVGLQGRLDEAERLIRHALEIFEKSLGGKHARFAEALNGLGRVLTLRRNFKEAEQMLRQAIDIQNKTLPVNYPDIAQTQFNLAVTLELQERYEEAYAIARRGAEALAGRVLAGEETLSAYAGLEPMRVIFGRAATLAWASAQTDVRRRQMLSEQAFLWAQWAQRTSAGAALSQSAARGAARTDKLRQLVREQQDLLAMSKALDGRYLAASSHQGEDYDDGFLNSLRAEIKRVDDRLKEIAAMLEANFPEYAALVRAKPVSITKVQRVLNPGEVLLFYHLDERNALVWLVTREDARWERLSLTTQAIAERVRILRCGLDDTMWKDARAPTCGDLLKVTLRAGKPLPFNTSVAYGLTNYCWGRSRTSRKEAVYSSFPRVHSRVFHCTFSLLIGSIVEFPRRMPIIAALLGLRAETP